MLHLSKYLLCSLHFKIDWLTFMPHCVRVAHCLSLFRIALLLLGLVLLLFCYRFTKRHREEEDWSPSPGPPSVYVIPIYEEEQEDGREINEAISPPPCRDPPMYSRNISPPPPYRVQHWVHSHTFIIFQDEFNQKWALLYFQLEPPSYQDPPAYSELPWSSSCQPEHVPPSTAQVYWNHDQRDCDVRE